MEEYKSPSSASSPKYTPDGTIATTASTKPEACHSQDADQSAFSPGPDDEQPRGQQLRRSSRKKASKRPAPSSLASERKRLSSTNIMTEPTRRNPKRKASESSKLPDGLSSDLVSEALKPLDLKDIEEWEGWAELESDPAFFNTILRDLGVNNVKVQELVSLEEEYMGFLPKPIFGLVFLFQYLPPDEMDCDDEQGGDLWFANQTTHNACATVALLNIIMNVSQVQLGTVLTDFKDSTMSMDSASRGHSLSLNNFIRGTHNSLTRRMDHLNADLALENEASEAKPKKAKNGKKGGEGKGKAKKQPVDDFAYHFIGYVEINGEVWELDGMKHRPQKLGPVNSDDWTGVARPQIEARMAQYEDSQLTFSLLALCRSPLASLSRKIAEGIASLRHLHLVAPLKEGVGENWQPEEESIVRKADDPGYLPQFRLTPEDVLKAEIPAWVRNQVSQLDSTEKATELHKELEVETKAVMGEFVAEIISAQNDELRVKGRKKDYGPALHKWLSKLAGTGILDALINSPDA